MKFDDWWKKYGVKLFGMKKKTDKPKICSHNKLTENLIQFICRLNLLFIKVRGKMYKRET